MQGPEHQIKTIPAERLPIGKCPQSGLLITDLHIHRFHQNHFLAHRIQPDHDRRRLHLNGDNGLQEDPQLKPTLNNNRRPSHPIKPH